MGCVVVSLFFVVACTSTGPIVKPEEQTRISKTESKTVTPSAEVPAILVKTPETQQPLETQSNDEGAEETADDGQDLMEKALEVLEAADESWVAGDIESTLNNLDKAYALLIDTNGDAELARQKDDIRLLISRRILAVYSSQQTRTNGTASEIPMKINANVEREIRSFQGPEREFFLSSYQRSGIYRNLILEELRKAGMPEELVWLPLVESGFKVHALSHARALGMWQFIPSTGYKFGLTRDDWVDERMDVLKSTQAAIAYMKELHAMFGDWMTVLAAYNCGEGRVLRLISRQHINYFDRFWDLYNQLPRETARYVPRFLATLHIVKDPKKYGFDLPAFPDTTLRFEKVSVDRMMKIQDIASKMEVSEELMTILNAELRHKITPDRVYELSIPEGMSEKFQQVANEIPAAQKPVFSESRTYVRHSVKPGETVTIIARRYRVSAAEIIRLNKLSRQGFIVTGQVIRVPVSSRRTQGGSSPSAASSSRTPSPSGNLYTIKPGDTLLGIAKRFNIPVARLKEINNLKTNQIQAGQVLRLSTRGAKKDDSNALVQSSKVKPIRLADRTLTAEDLAALGTDKHLVTRGDDLSGIASKYNLSRENLALINNITGDETLRPGQVLVIHH
jgi:membrane-bound lytic murein transglycosylase D